MSSLRPFCCALGRLVPFLASIALSACGEGSLELTLLSTTDNEHARRYLDGSFTFDQVSATMSCEDSLPDACLLRLDANSRSYSGAAQELIVHVATGAQELPGVVDLAATYQDAYQVAPVTYNAVEEVSTGDLISRYSYSCQYNSGTMVLYETPEVGQPLTGQLEILMDCIETLTPNLVVPTELTAGFAVVVAEPLY